MGVNPVTRFFINRPWTHKWLIPLSKWYATKMGYRQLGLKYEDLLPEENEITQLALKRLPPKEAYDRVFRLRRAFQVSHLIRVEESLGEANDNPNIVSQLSLSHHILPPHQWTPYEEDTPYLSPIIDEIEKEMKEREDLESMVVKRKQ